MRVLVAGSSGFIGTALIGSLSSRGATVHRAVRHRPAAGEVGIDLAGRHLDLEGLPDRSLNGIDVVFNLAGEPLTPRRWGPAKLERIRASRILATDLLARAIAAGDGPPPTLISMSAVGYYGSRGDEILDERSAAGTGFLAEVCRAWETAAAPARDAGARVVTLRSGVVLSGRGGALRTQSKIFGLGLGGRLGTGRQWTSWICLDDLTEALWRCATDASLSGAVNAVAPNPIRNSDFTAALGRALHRPAVLRVPRPLLAAAVGSRVANEFLLASQRVLPGRLLSAGFSFAHADLEDCLDSIGSNRLDGIGSTR